MITYTGAAIAVAIVAAITILSVTVPSVHAFLFDQLPPALLPPSYGRLLVDLR